jgi:hypothetical protein
MKADAPNSQFNLARPESFSARIIGHQRRKMYEQFLRWTEVGEADTILDVGATSDRSYDWSNYVAAWYPRKGLITAMGIDNASFLERCYPGMKYVRADGLNLPFIDGAFDIVHCGAVLEHVGSSANQTRLVQECARVTRKAFFMTTPNRWFPIEVHTKLPLLHWLPKGAFRSLQRRSPRYAFFAEETNLNLLTAHELRRIFDCVPDFQMRIVRARLCGCTSNLLLVGRRISNPDGPKIVPPLFSCH